MKITKIFWVLFFIPILIFPQSDTLKTFLKDIIVTATKTETPFYTIASSISIISSEEINQKQYYSVVDLLKEVPGVVLTQQGSYGKLSNIFMRGSNSNHTLVLIDGVEINDASSPNNAFDFSLLTTSDIERIEIVRGPQSTLYGSDAIAGVVNIVLKEGEKNKKLNIKTIGGSNNFYSLNLNSTGLFGPIEYFFSAIKSGSDGISTSSARYGNAEKDGFINNGITSRIGFNIPSIGKLKLTYKFVNLDSELDQNEINGDDVNFKFDTEEQLFNSNLHVNSFGGKWEKIFNASYVKKYSHTIDGFDNLHPHNYMESYSSFSRFKFDWQNNLRLLENNLITVGFETETEKAYSNFYSETVWGPFESNFPKASSKTIGVYLQDQINLFNSIFASVGFRYDHHEKFGGVTTFRIAPAYFINSTNSKIKFTYGTGFKSPSLYYLFDPMFGNPELKPEKSVGWDFGFEQNLFNDIMQIDITYFNLKLENMFGFDASFKTINIAKASSKGIEISTKYKVNNDLSFNFNYTFNETKDEYDRSSDFDKQLIRRPKHNANLIVNYLPFQNFSLNAQFRLVGERDDKDFSSFPIKRITLPGYLLFNLSTSYELIKEISLSGRIENIFNKHYEEVLYFGTLGRSFYFGIEVNL
jgi:vitamin B12 transporter